MDWNTIAQLIIRYGFEFAAKLVELWLNRSPVNQATLAELKSLAAQSAEAKLDQALARLNPPLSQDQIQQLKAYTKLQ
ncbi:MAG: hypothetical protein NZ739_08155 [Verrucomicrobiae bacterium]|nr:hypothetical protein [Verrucomicrobiae bacterium]